MQSQLHWAGHLIRMKDHNLAKKMLYSEPSQSKCSQGSQKKHLKNTLRVYVKSFGVIPNCLEYLAQDRDKWHEVVKHGAKFSEARKNAATELYRKIRKALPHQPLLTPFLVLTAQNSSMHRLVALTICAFMDPILNQMVLIDFNGQRSKRYIFVYINACIHMKYCHK